MLNFINIIHLILTQYKYNYLLKLYYNLNKYIKEKQNFIYSAKND
jgi:3-methyladenine DNA glycosylase AlkD